MTMTIITEPTFTIGADSDYDMVLTLRNFSPGGDTAGILPMNSERETAYLTIPYGYLRDLRKDVDRATRPIKNSTYSSFDPENVMFHIICDKHFPATHRVISSYLWDVKLSISTENGGYAERIMLVANNMWYEFPVPGFINKVDEFLKEVDNLKKSGIVIED